MEPRLYALFTCLK